MNELPPMPVPEDPGRLTSAGLKDVAQYIQENYAWNATWLAALLGVITLVFLVYLTRRLWIVWAEEIHAVYVFWGICRGAGLSISDTVELWSSSSNLSTAQRLSLLLSRGSLKRIKQSSATRRAGKALFGDAQAP